jgi:Family of unknown function (DUF6384)
MPEAAMPSPAGAAAAAARPKLDDLMLSMDVVDTLRHQEAFVARELDDDQRETELIERLRRIYRDQGIEVPDRIIKEGVKALKESRFVYTPPAPGLEVTLARAWIMRGKIGAMAAALFGAIGVLWMAYFFGVERPARIALDEARVEISETLPKALDEAYASASAEAKTATARAKADQIAADGRAALSRRDAAGAKSSVAALDQLRAELRRDYKIMIVNRPGEPSGVFRIPDRNTAARNYYVIVEAIGPGGKAIPLAVASEEDGATRTVTKWGLRVSQQMFDSVRRDKDDDGIIQNREVGAKLRGALDVVYAVPVLGGAINQW